MFDADCVLPSIPESGSYKVSEGGSVVSFSCENGTTLRGSSQLKCMDDGSGYNTSVPECGNCYRPSNIHKQISVCFIF